MKLVSKGFERGRGAMGARSRTTSARRLPSSDIINFPWKVNLRAQTRSDTD